MGSIGWCWVGSVGVVLLLCSCGSDDTSGGGTGGSSVGGAAGTSGQAGIAGSSGSGGTSNAGGTAGGGTGGAAGGTGGTSTGGAAGGGGSAGSVSFELPVVGKKLTYRLTRADAGKTTIDVPAQMDETQEINGTAWRKLSVYDPAAATYEGFIAYVRTDQGKLWINGADVFQPPLGSDPKKPSFSYTFDTPLSGPVDAAVGAQQNTSTDGKLCFGAQCDSYHIEVTWTVVSVAESVTVPFGKVDDCIHVHIVQKASDLGPTALDVDWWLKSGIGIVKDTMPPGFDGMELVSIQ